MGNNRNAHAQDGHQGGAAGSGGIAAGECGLRQTFPTRPIKLLIGFAPASTALPLIEGKKVRALGWTIPTRGPALPDLPTLSEAGLPGFDTSIWFGINAPATAPAAVVDRLGAAVVAATRSEAVAKAFPVQGIEPLVGGPAEYARYIETETVIWADVAVKAGLAK
jgi:tripartite-type tricarboxylate transporter receptor subunit TctC